MSLESAPDRLVEDKVDSNASFENEEDKQAGSGAKDKSQRKLSEDSFLTNNRGEQNLPRMVPLMKAQSLKTTDPLPLIVLESLAGTSTQVERVQIPSKASGLQLLSSSDHQSVSNPEQQSLI